jgi:hypothetical protein|tara:strand:- start:1656 stop:1817 length:162 start_codon:yes stop_codon:yes gene_type:complete
MNYIKDRILEPSSWSAIAAVLLGVSIFIDMPWLMILAAIAAAGALFLKEHSGF